MTFAKNKNRILKTLTQRLLEEKSMSEIAKALYDELRELLNIHRLGIAVVSDDRKSINSRLNLSTTKLKLFKGYKVPLESSSLKSVINSGRSRIIPDLTAYLKAKPTSVSTRLIISEGMKSSVTMPLISNKKPIGDLFLSSQELSAFQETHIDFIEDFLPIIALSLERGLLQEKLEETSQALNLAIIEKEGLSDALLKYGKKTEESFDRAADPTEESLLQTYPSPLRFEQPMSWQAWEREIIHYTLTISKEKIYGKNGAADILDLAPTTLQSKMKRLGVRKNSDS